MSASMYRSAGLLVAAIAVAGAAPLFAAQDMRVVEAAAGQDAVAVRTLIDEGADVNVPWGDGSTALMWAAHWDDLGMADLLLDAGAEVNGPDDHGVTPLERAAVRTPVSRWSRSCWRRAPMQTRPRPVD